VATRIQHTESIGWRRKPSARPWGSATALYGNLLYDNLLCDSSGIGPTESPRLRVFPSRRRYGR
jgi:hypothetical protein